MLRYTFLLLLLICSHFSISQSQKATNQKSIEDRLIVRAPYLQQATDHSMIIRWRTLTPVKGVVRYGVAPDQLNSKAKNDEKSVEQIVTIRGLKSYTRYYYAIEDISGKPLAGTNGYFYTLPKPGTEGFYRIGVFGDCGTNSKPQVNAKETFLKYLGNNYLNAWILLGDNAYPDGTDAQYQTNFFDMYKDDLLKNYPLFPAPGNHDYREITKSNPKAPRTKEVSYFRNFTVPVKGESGGTPSRNQSFYSYDIGNAHFISLDSYGEDDGLRMYDTLSAQVQWLKKDLEKNKNKGWVIAYWHHPPYTMGTHNSDKEEELIRIRQEFLKILERYDVDMVLCGHSHTFERSSLMNGYYGSEKDFNADRFNLSQSSGLYNGSKNSCPYIKNSDKGIVYVVTGSAGKIGKPQSSWPHAAMQFSDASETGASIIEIEGNRLDLKWITTGGKIRDHFTMMKDVNKSTVIKAKKGDSVTLTASYVGNYNWSAGNSETKTITVNPGPGRNIYTVKDNYNCLQDTFEVLVSE